MNYTPDASGPAASCGLLPEIVPAIASDPVLAHCEAVEKLSQAAAPAPDLPLPLASLKIAPAVSSAQRDAAAALIAQRYAWRGYGTVNLPPLVDSRFIVLVASVGDRIVGTITVGLDGPLGLNCEKEFADEIGELRRRNRRICEITRLAVAEGVGGPQVPAALFFGSFVVADRLRGCDAMLMEVNPRHRRFYQRVFNGEQLGEVRHNPGVEAPAILIALPTEPLTRCLDDKWAGGHATDAGAGSPASPPIAGPILARHYGCYADAIPAVDAQAMLAQLRAVETASRAGVRKRKRSKGVKTLSPIAQRAACGLQGLRKRPHSLSTAQPE